MLGFISWKFEHLRRHACLMFMQLQAVKIKAVQATMNLFNRVFINSGRQIFLYVVLNNGQGLPPPSQVLVQSANFLFFYVYLKKNQ